MLRRDGATTAVVFSHPNHELAIFGMLQSLRPSLVYLTDGGGERRVEETRAGLRSIGLAEHACFLGYTEQSFYDALLERDAGFYADVAARVRDVLHELRPTQILCDSVEFYNPVHDMSLPIVRAALREEPAAEIFEVPLVHQTDGEEEAYRVQRPAPACGAVVEWPISSAELDRKVEARDRIYTMLAAQMGPLLTELPRDALAVEVVMPAAAELPEPGSDRVLRYERRARLLLERGDIERAITYAGHWVPVATSLF
ncbi:MAG TPA: hypothetical protein VFD92_10970 [Candidatus Binatia bacterium]|nr:hypothetical protein [Candidatus Binatia bacterium]